MHRDVIYSERAKILNEADLKINIQEMVNKEISGLVATYCPNENSNEWDLDTFRNELATIFPSQPSIMREQVENMHPEEIEDELTNFAINIYDERETQSGQDQMRVLERLVMLRTIDSHWVQHLTAMENLRQGIGLHAFGQRDPLVMFKREGHEMFQTLLDKIQNDIAHTIFKVAMTTNNMPRNVTNIPRSDTLVSKVAERDRRTTPNLSTKTKVGRNEPCPCGSGKKYKRCHGLAA